MSYLELKILIYLFYQLNVILYDVPMSSKHANENMTFCLLLLLPICYNKGAFQ